MNVTFRKGTPDDANACAEICYNAFVTISRKHNFPPEFPSPEVAQHLVGLILSLPYINSLIAESDGHIVGSNFLREGGTIAGVGRITVDSQVQNRSIGRRLMENVLVLPAFSPNTVHRDSN